MDRVPSFGERTNFPTLRDALHSTAADLGIGPVTPWQYDPQVGRLYQSPVTSPGHWLISPDQKRVDAATVGGATVMTPKSWLQWRIGDPMARSRPLPPEFLQEFGPEPFARGGVVRPRTRTERVRAFERVHANTPV